MNYFLTLTFPFFSCPFSELHATGGSIRRNILFSLDETTISSPATFSSFHSDKMGCVTDCCTMTARALAGCLSQCGGRQFFLVVEVIDGRFEEPHPTRIVLSICLLAVESIFVLVDCGPIILLLLFATCTPLSTPMNWNS